LAAQGIPTQGIPTRWQVSGDRGSTHCTIESTNMIRSNFSPVPKREKIMRRRTHPVLLVSPTRSIRILLGWSTFLAVWILAARVGYSQSENLRELPPPLPPGFDLNATEFMPQPSSPALNPPIANPTNPNTGGSGTNVFELLDDSLGSPVARPSLAESIDQFSPEISPIEQQHEVWYRQYPWMWIPWSGWVNSVELGLNGTDGNSQTTSLQAGADLQRITDLYTFSVDFDYQRTQAAGAKTQNNGRLNVDYDRLLGESSWSAFGKLGLEYDEFKAFNLRLNLNSGLGYYWFRNDTSTLVTRFGAGASKEIGAADDDWKPEAVFGYEATQQLTARQKLKGKLDYFPEWSNFNNYRMVSDLSWEILLDGEDNLSLKLAATNRYDSTPQGAKPNDLFYSALLLWKF
jgi:putative salt-induced outer membrane protein YdiY